MLAVSAVEAVTQLPRQVVGVYRRGSSRWVVCVCWCDVSVLALTIDVVKLSRTWCWWLRFAVGDSNTNRGGEGGVAFCDCGWIGWLHCRVELLVLAADLLVPVLVGMAVVALALAVVMAVVRMRHLVGGFGIVDVRY